MGTRTLIPGGQLVVNVPPNSGANTASFNTEASGAFEVIIIIDHPTNVNNVEVSVWGSDDTGFLAQFRFAYEEMHRIV
ncbi:hypothetical protein V7068_20235 [Bacillus sp. JJ634]